MNRLAAALAGAAGIGVVAYALLSSQSDEEQIRERLDALEAAVRVDGDTSTNPVLRIGAVQSQFEDIFTESTSYRIPELSSGERGRHGLAALAAKSGMYFDALSVDFGDVDVQVVDGAHQAQVRAMATVTATRRGGQVERDDRRVSFGFTETDDGWRIDDVRVSPKGEAD